MAAQIRMSAGPKRNWQPVTVDPIATDKYPATTSSLIGALHDVAYYQGMLSNQNNYAKDSRLDVYEISNGNFIQRTLSDDALCRSYLGDINSTPPGNKVSFRIIFCYIEQQQQQTSFGCRISLSQPVVLQMLEELQVSPQVACAMLGEPDYWAPGDFVSQGPNAAAQKLEFFCQHPRWHIHTRGIPMSVYMTHDLSDSTTSYIVFTDRHQSRLEHVKRRLTDSFASANPADTRDPFMFHCLIIHEMFLDAKSVITPLRGNLYSQLNLVDAYSTKPAQKRDRNELEKVTIQLHVVSQDIDSMTASAEMAAMIIRRMQGAHDRFRELVAPNAAVNANTKIFDTLRYLLESADSQKRWLMSYKARKDIALNLVFNLVTQQDATTSTTIAREAKADGAAMKTIAALTMVFLPGTFLSSVFSMSMLDGAKWWLYVALAVPLTIVVVSSWWLWITRPDLRVWRPRAHAKALAVAQSVP